MTNQEKFIQVFGIDAWRQMIVFSGLAKQFKEYWIGECKDFEPQDNLCSSCTNIGCEFQSGIVRTKCAFYMPPHIESDNCGNYVVMQEPKTGRCKDCKWWKDSDGVYRRGVRAESKCPINNVSVNHGFGYCYMFEPQEGSDKE